MNLDKGHAAFAKLIRFQIPDKQKAPQEQPESPEEASQNLPEGDPKDVPHMLISKYRAVKDKADKKQKIVHLLSTCHNSSMVNTGKRDRENEVVRKPSMITDYNKHMGGVDMVDQQLHGLHTLRKSYKWYKKLAFRLMSQAALNSHKIFCKVTGKKMTFLDYLQIVITSLILINPPIENIPRDETITRLQGRHFPSLKVAKADAKCQRPTKKCRVCYAKGKRTDKGQPIKTTYVCAYCPSEPGLHPDNCFEEYHTKLDYIE